MNKIVSTASARWNALKPATRSTVTGVLAAVLVGGLTVASAQTTGSASLDYSGIMGAGKSEVTGALTGAAPQMAALAGMVGGAGWILRKLFGI